MATTVREIIQKYLIDNHYHGLCNNDCGCHLRDLMPCCSDGTCISNESPADCQPGYVKGDDIVARRLQACPSDPLAISKPDRKSRERGYHNLLLDMHVSDDVPQVWRDKIRKIMTE